MYAVAGVTGNTGAVVAGALLDRGAPVRVIARAPGRAAPLVARGAELAVADLGDRQALAAALRGTQGAYLLVPPDLASPAYLASRARIAEALAGAVRDSGVPHVVLLSSIGAQHASGTGVIRALHDAEGRLRASGARLTLLRAAYFMENWASVLDAVKSGGVLPSMLLPPERPIEMVATRDIGLAAARALLEPARGERIIELSGPAEYSPAQVAAILARLLARPVQVASIPSGERADILQSFGISADVAALFTEMTDGIASGRVAFAGGNAERWRGDTSLESLLGALVAAG